jgi:hypothetical protein
MKIAIQKPYNISIRGLCLDASEANTFTWQISGSIQSSYSIEIRNNSTNVVVYSFPQTSSFATSHTIPVSTLTNGVEYKIAVTAWDSSATTATSDFEIFQTSSRPVVAINTIGIVGNSSNTFSATYSQAQSVVIKSWIVYLYDNSNILIAQSDIQTSTTLQYLFSGFESSKTYKIEFQATSAKGMLGTSGKVSFSVAFNTPILNVNITAQNVANAGVKLSWTAKQIFGHSDSTTYISGEKLDVRQEKSVVFDEGYQVLNDFTLKTWVEGLTNYTISNTTEVIMSADPPANVNALWIKNADYSVPKIMEITSKSTAPSNTNSIWVKSDNHITDTSYGVIFDLSAPFNVNNLWVGVPDHRKSTELLSANGDNGRISIEYYNSKFWLLKYDLAGTSTEITTATATGNQFFVYIQQIGETYNLGVQVIS